MDNPGTHLRKEQIKKIIELYDTKPYGVNAIAHKLDISLGAVRKYLREAKRI